MRGCTCGGARTWASIGAEVAPFRSVIQHLGFFPPEESTDIKCAETVNLLNYKYAAADANEPKLENKAPMGGWGGGFLFRHLLVLKLPSN